MNTETLLNVVKRLIANRPTSKTDKYYITILEGRLVCVPVDENILPEIMIFHFTEDDAKKGFTSHQRKIIKNRLFKFYERIKK